MNSTYFILLSLSSILTWQLCYCCRLLFEVTGLNKNIAKTQTINLFFRSGFSTSESELVLYDKVRRKIALLTTMIGFISSLVILGFLICFMTSLNSFVFKNFLIILIIDALVIGALVALSLYKGIRIKLKTKLYNILYKKYTTSTQNIIVFGDKIYDKMIATITIKQLPGALAGLSLGQINFDKTFKVKILAVENKNNFTTDIDDNYVLNIGDKLEVYGNPKVIKKLFSIE